jgi:hypothetical protein
MVEETSIRPVLELDVVADVFPQEDLLLRENLDVFRAFGGRFRDALLIWYRALLITRTLRARNMLAREDENLAL